MKHIFKNYIEYLADNPEGYWFKRKLYGWGWTPATKEGWFVTVVILASVFVLAFRVEQTATLGELVFTSFTPITLLIIALVIVAWRTGERPKWHWGFPEDTSTYGTERTHKKTKNKAP